MRSSEPPLLRADFPDVLFEIWRGSRERAIRTQLRIDRRQSAPSSVLPVAAFDEDRWFCIVIAVAASLPLATINNTAMRMRAWGFFRRVEANKS